MGQYQIRMNVELSSYEPDEFRSNSELTGDVLSPRDGTKTLWRPQSEKFLDGFRRDTFNRPCMENFMNPRAGSASENRRAKSSLG